MYYRIIRADLVFILPVRNMRRKQGTVSSDCNGGKNKHLKPRTMKTDKKGLYKNGEFVTDSYVEAVKSIYGLKELPNNFIVDESTEANGFSVIDNRGVMHIYELDAKKFYNYLLDLD